MLRTLDELIAHRIDRRRLLSQAAKGVGALLLTSALPRIAVAAETTGTVSASFRPLPLEITDTLHVAEGHRAEVLMAWGDPVLKGAPAFRPDSQSPDSQELQFGYNCDYTVFMPLPAGSANSDHGLLCVNHEYTNTARMFPGYAGDKTREQAATELSAHGHSVVEIKRGQDGAWKPVANSAYNRRLSARTTAFTLKGPAAGTPRMRTAEDPSGTAVIGTLSNCAGGHTPWGTVLVAEENFNFYFSGKAKDAHERENHRRYGIGGKGYGWSTHYPRFDVSAEPNEPNRFGWVVEYDPYDPARAPVKHTALGRFKHEGATVCLAPDGRAVVYSGDDEQFQFLYRFVSRGTYSRGAETNRALLEEGTLYAAKFDEQGVTWLPLVHGANGLAQASGFASQADVLIETRRAAAQLGATPMDRPEDVEVHPATGAVYIALTKNSSRKEPDAANPRAKNRYGHILEMLPPLVNGKADHAADRFGWDLLLLGGNPADPEDAAWYQGKDVAQQYLACPDNLAIDAAGRLWVGTDGQDDAIKACDSLYLVPVVGATRGMPQRFLNAPRGAEVTGPSFTPDGTTLFVSIQHPGDEDGSSYDSPTTRWPAAATSKMPPRAAVVAIRREDGAAIGGAA